MKKRYQQTIQIKEKKTKVLEYHLSYPIPLFWANLHVVPEGFGPKLLIKRESERVWLDSRFKLKSRGRKRNPIGNQCAFPSLYFKWFKFSIVNSHWAYDTTFLGQDSIVGPSIKIRKIFELLKMLKVKFLGPTRMDY